MASNPTEFSSDTIIQHASLLKHNYQCENYWERTDHPHVRNSNKIKISARYYKQQTNSVEPISR